VAEDIRIRALGPCTEQELNGLAAVLVDCVHGGASVSFMLPLSLARAADYWRGVAQSAANGERVLLAAEDAAGSIVGTVQLILALPENQPHRAEIAKMLVQRSARGRGIGAALLMQAQAHARQRQRTLLVLDTASDAAARLYERHGWQRCGQIPGYALFPDGRPCATTIYFRSLR
jgi:ribosomal protein S18 acetylase RimI-like enzyme